MNIKLNPLELIKILKADKYRENENVHDYIKSSAIEASNLADIWEEAVYELNANNKIGKELIGKINTTLGVKYFNCNGKPYTRLQHFYSLTSRAIGDKVNNYWLDTIVDTLARIIYDRDLTKQKFEQIINDQFSTHEQRNVKTKDLLDVVSKLRKDAEELYVLAQNIKLEKYK